MEAHSLLERYLKISNAMRPVSEILASVDTTSPTLWHLDLHLDDKIMEPSSIWMPRKNGSQLPDLAADYAFLFERSEACHKFYESERYRKHRLRLIMSPIAPSSPTVNIPVVGHGRPLRGRTSKHHERFPLRYAREPFHISPEIYLTSQKYSIKISYYPPRSQAGGLVDAEATAHSKTYTSLPHFNLSSHILVFNQNSAKMLPNGKYHYLEAASVKVYFKSCPPFVRSEQKDYISKVARNAKQATLQPGEEGGG